MAFNKAKALQEAHKFVMQGKPSRAIKQYQRIAEQDPSDLTLLNVLGDLYAQDNNLPEALKYFYKLAEAYSREGYRVKAVAIYKKISKIDRNTMEPLLKLAELSSALGLAREAREHYKNAFEFFEKKSQWEDALAVLRELCPLEPHSSGVRLKLAQLAERAGEHREAAEAYLETAMLAHQQGDGAAAESALAKAAELDPKNPRIHLHRARQALASQRPEEVKSILDHIPGLQSDPEARRLLLQSHLASGNLEGAHELLLDVFQGDPSDFSPVADFAGQCIEKERFGMALEALAAIAPDLIARRDTGPMMELLRRLWKASPDRVDTLDLAYRVAERTADETTIPEVLEALGNAHVQADQLEKAEHAYARLVAREPENETYKELLKQILAKQGKEYVPLGQTPFISSDIGLEVGSEPLQGGAAAAPVVDPGQAAIVKGAITNSDLYVRDGLIEKGVQELEKTLRVYPEQIDIHRQIVEVCREKIPARAAQAAETLAAIYSGLGDSSAAKRYHEEALELAQTAAAAEAGSKPPQDVSQSRPAVEEIDLSLPAAGQETADEETALPAPREIPLEFESSRRPEPAAGGFAPSQGTPAEELSLSGQAPPESAPGKESAFNYEESREEIDFYLHHGFHDEAREAVSELERKYPQEAGVAELSRRVDESQQEANVPEGCKAAPETAAPEAGEPERELPTSFAGTGGAAGSVDEGPLHGQSAAASGPEDAVERLAGELASTLDDLHDSAASPAASAADPVENVPPQSAEDASADLGSLLDELNAGEETSEQTPDDAQTHYNLGVAFREMGLLEEAIGEFQKVVKDGGSSRSGPNFLQGCTLLAACFMDKEMPAIAVKWYARALETPGLDSEAVLALYYDMGAAFEKAGDTTAALEKFTEVYSQNIDYRDVAEKIRLLRQSAR